MTALEQLRPTEKKNVIELVAATGIDVTPWANTKAGAPVSNPASNGGHCYEWVFSEDESKFTFCLWHGDCATDGDGIFNAGNVRTAIRDMERTKGNSTKIRRALRFDEKLQVAQYRKAGVRVILVDGRIQMASDDKASKVAKRELDPAMWHVANYDRDTGDYVLRRTELSVGASPPTASEKAIRELSVPESSKPSIDQSMEDNPDPAVDKDMPGWKRAYMELLAIGHPATAGEIGTNIKSGDSGYNGANVGPDLCKITVNCFARGHHQPSASPRKTNQGHEHDLLFKMRLDNNVYYTPYDIATHGIWELFEDPNARTKDGLNKLSPNGRPNEFLKIWHQNLKIWTKFASVVPE